MFNGHCECYVLRIIHNLSSFSYISTFQIHVHLGLVAVSLSSSACVQLIMESLQFPAV